MSAASETLRVRVIRDNMTCETCDRMLWDCRCVASAECVHCEIEYPPVVGSDDEVFCPERPGMPHEWKSTEREP